MGLSTEQGTSYFSFEVPEKDHLTVFDLEGPRQDATLSLGVGVKGVCTHVRVCACVCVLEWTDRKAKKKVGQKRRASQTPICLD